MITVHHLGVSQSERIVWLCEELGLPYELIRYDRMPTGSAPETYKALHPMGTSPVIEDEGVVLAESNAVVDYILGRYGEGRLAIAPADKRFADYLFWLHFANGTLLAGELCTLIINRVGGMDDKPLVQWRKRRSDALFAMVEKRLGEVPYFAGDEFTAADIMMVFPLTTMRAFQPRDFSGQPNTLDYLKRISERPAYQRAMTKGDPGMEPWTRA